MEVILNTPPDGQVGVIAGTVDVAGEAVAQLLGCDAVVVRFPAAGSGWSVQALLGCPPSVLEQIRGFVRAVVMGGKDRGVLPVWRKKSFCGKK